MAKGKKLGPRVTVQFSAGKRTAKGATKTKANNPVYVYMLKSTAEFFGFKIVPNAGITNKKGARIAVRGSKGAGSIKVLDPSTKDSDKKKYKSIPVPASATIAEVQKFLAGASKSKPESFASVDGRTYPVASSNKATK